MNLSLRFDQLQRRVTNRIGRKLANDSNSLFMNNLIIKNNKLFEWKLRLEQLKRRATRDWDD